MSQHRASSDLLIPLSFCVVERSIDLFMLSAQCLAVGGFQCGEPVAVSILNETLHFKQNVHSPIVGDLSTQCLYRL